MPVKDDDNGGSDFGPALLALAAIRTATDRTNAVLAGQSAYGQDLAAAEDEGAAQALLNLVPGEDVQAYSALLKALADLPAAPNAALFFNADGVPDLATLSVYGRGLLVLSGTPALKALLALAIADVSGLGAALGLKADLVSGLIPSGQIPSIDAGKLTGTIDLARLPILPSQRQVISAGLLADLTSAQQGNIGQGTVVTTTDGLRYVYTGSGSKTDPASYIALADITPTLAAVEGLVAALAGKQAQDPDLDAIAALTTTTFGRSFLTQADAAAARSLIGAVIGTNVQAYDTDLDAIAALSTTVFGRGLLTLSDAAAGRLAFGSLAKAGDTLTGALDEATPVTLASAATVDIGTAASNIVDITGTTAITSFGTRPAGAVRRLRFLSSGLVLTYNATSLILPGLANIATQAGDTAEFRSLGGGNWMCRQYQRADGTALIAAAVTGGGGFVAEQTITGSGTITAADKGRLLLITASAGAAITLTAASAATLGNGFYCGILREDGALATVTIAAASGQTIEGRASVNVYQEGFTLTGNGSVLRTPDRVHGWVPLGQVALTGQSLTEVQITNGFLDPEVREVEVVVQNLTLSASGTTGLRPMKNGQVLANPNYVIEAINTAGTAAPAITSVSNATASGGANLVSTASTGPILATVRALDTLSTIAADGRLAFDAQQAGATRKGVIYDTSVTAQVSGISLVPAGTNITAITYTAKGFRP